jgi:predicted N-acetyltransferase YhbS
MTTILLSPAITHSKTAPARSRMSVRPITAADVEACGQVAYAAHSTMAAAHNFPCEQPSVQFSIGLIDAKVKDPNAQGFVAEQNSRIVGSVFLNMFPPEPMAVIGPFTVDPNASGAGRLLMQAALEAARAQHIERIRLVQSPSHLRSLALYAGLGFEVREPLVLVSGTVPIGGQHKAAVRKATADDIEACVELCTVMHGFARGFELRGAIDQQVATVAVYDDRIVGYMAGLGFRGHAVAETTEHLKALIAGAPAVLGPGFFVPTRNGELLRWLLANGFRAMWPATLMTKGSYHDCVGAFLPSIAC